MSLSLSEQLARQRPSGLAKQKKRRYASLLFTPLEASDVDDFTIASIGRNGFLQLVKQSPALLRLEGALFGSAATTERDRLTAEENVAIDRTVSATLQLIAPYLLLKPAHKLFEHLLRRFEVERLNVDAVLAAALPFHDSPLFGRIVSLLHLDVEAGRGGRNGAGQRGGRRTDSMWGFLAGVKKHATPVKRALLVHQCVKERALLAFVSKAARAMVENADAEPKLHVSFAAILSIEILRATPRVDSNLIRLLLPDVLFSLATKRAPRAQMAAHMVIAQLCQSTKLSKPMVTAIIRAVSASIGATTARDGTTCLAIVYQTQRHNVLPSNVAAALLKVPRFPALLRSIAAKVDATPLITPLVVQLATLATSEDGHEGALAMLEQLLTDSTVSRRDIAGLVKLLLRREVQRDAAREALPPACSRIVSAAAATDPHAVATILSTLVDTRASNPPLARLALNAWRKHLAGTAYRPIDESLRDVSSSAAALGIVPSVVPLSTALSADSARTRRRGVDEMAAAIQRCVSSGAGGEANAASKLRFHQDALVERLRVEEDSGIVQSLLRVAAHDGSAAPKTMQLVPALIAVVRRWSAVAVRDVGVADDVLQKALTALVSHGKLAAWASAPERESAALVRVAALLLSLVVRPVAAVDTASGAAASAASKSGAAKLSSNAERRAQQKLKKQNAGSQGLLALALQCCEVVPSALLRGITAANASGSASGVLIAAAANVSSDAADASLLNDIGAVLEEAELWTALPLLRVLAEALVSSPAAAASGGQLAALLLKALRSAMARTTPSEASEDGTAVKSALHMVVNYAAADATGALVTTALGLILAAPPAWFSELQAELQTLLSTSDSLGEKHPCEFFLQFLPSDAKGSSSEGSGALVVSLRALAICVALLQASIAVAGAANAKRSPCGQCANLSQLLPALLVGLASLDVEIRARSIACLDLLVKLASVDATTLVLPTPCILAMETLLEHRQALVEDSSYAERQLATVISAAGGADAPQPALRWLVEKALPGSNAQRIARRGLSLLQLLRTSSVAAALQQTLLLPALARLSEGLQSGTWSDPTIELETAQLIVAWLFSGAENSKAGVATLRKHRFESLLKILSFAADGPAATGAWQRLQRSTLQIISTTLYVELSASNQNILTSRLCDALQHGVDVSSRAAQSAICRLPMDCKWIATQITSSSSSSASFRRETIILEALQSKMGTTLDEDGAADATAAASASDDASSSAADTKTAEVSTLRNVEHLPGALFKVLKAVVRGERFVSADATYATPLALSTLRQIARQVTDLEEGNFNVPLRSALVDACDMDAVIGILHASRSAPQTRAIALQLLGALAAALPQLLLSTFESTLMSVAEAVAGVDDTFTFHVLTNIVRSVIPPLMQFVAQGQREGRDVASEASVLMAFGRALCAPPPSRRLTLLHTLVSVSAKNRGVGDSRRTAPAPSLATTLAMLLLQEDASEAASMAHKLTRKFAVGQQTAALAVLVMVSGQIFNHLATMDADSSSSGSMLVDSNEEEDDEEDDEEDGDEQEDELHHLAQQIVRSIGDSPLGSSGKSVVAQWATTLLRFALDHLHSARFIEQAAAKRSGKRKHREAEDRLQAQLLLLAEKTLLLLFESADATLMDVSSDAVTAASSVQSAVTSSCEQLLEALQSLLTVPGFLAVVSKLWSVDDQRTRKHALQMFISKVQDSAATMSADETLLFLDKLDELHALVRVIADSPSQRTDPSAVVDARNALLAIHALARALAQPHPTRFEEVLDTVAVVGGFSLDGVEKQSHPVSSAALELKGLAFICSAPICLALGPRSVRVLGGARAAKGNDSQRTDERNLLPSLLGALEWSASALRTMSDDAPLRPSIIDLCQHALASLACIIGPFSSLLGPFLERLVRCIIHPSLLAVKNATMGT